MIYRFDRFELNEERRELRDGGRGVSLQPLTFDTLALLVRNHDRVVPKEELLEALWPEGFVAEGSLQRAISLVRAAINDDRHEVIRTFAGRGYRFCSPVQSIGEDVRLPNVAAPLSQPSEARSERRSSEPRIHYAKTIDGVSIAYWTLGAGAPFISMPEAPSTHVAREWDIPELRSWYEALSREWKLVRFDQRGGGLSDREVGELSMEVFQRDVEAVVDALGLESFVLFAYLDSTPVAIRYAARNPDKVSHLILWCPYAAGPELKDLPQITAVRALMDLDYALYMKTLAHVGLGWAAGEPVRRWASLMTESWPREMLVKMYAATAKYDVRNDLPLVRTPTLVMYPRGIDWFPEDVSRRVAAGIPNSRLALVDGSSGLLWVDDWQPVLDSIKEFLNEN